MRKNIFYLLSGFAFTIQVVNAQINCTALKNGCRVLQSPPSLYTIDPHTSKIDQGSVQALLDENPQIGWSSAEKSSFPMSFVFELSENFLLQKLVFNNECRKTIPGICAREVKIEISTTGPSSGFKETSVYILKENAISEFGINLMEARWVRMTIVSNYGHKELVELKDLQIIGKHAEPEPGTVNVTGLWDTNFDWVSLKKNDSGYVYGCYKWAAGELYSGKIDRRNFQFKFIQKEDGREGWVTLTLNKEGNKLSGIWGFEKDHSQFGIWEFSKRSETPNPCPNDELVKEIKLDSASQSSESFPVIKNDRIPLKVQLMDENNKFIQGKISVLKNSEVVSEKSTNEGITTFQIAPSNSSKLTVKGVADGYMSESYAIDSLIASDVPLVLRLKKLEAGKSVVLDNIRFDKGKSNLLEQSYADLDKVVQMMTEYPNMEIELAGHTDNQGDPKKNVVLSQSRVKEVKNYLVTKGVKPNRISGIGYGGSKPIASNAKEETRKLNRRVEFKIIKM